MLHLLELIGAECYVGRVRYTLWCVCLVDSSSREVQQVTRFKYKVMSGHSNAVVS